MLFRSLFENAENLLLRSVIMALRPMTVASGNIIIKEGEVADEMYLICRGEVEVVNKSGDITKLLKDGDYFGEIGLLMSIPRVATIRAKTDCDLFVLNKSSFSRILGDYPQFAQTIVDVAKSRFDVTVSVDSLTK